MVCPYCQTPLKPSDIFCPKCNNLANNGYIAYYQQQGYPQQQQGYPQQQQGYPQQQQGYPQQQQGYPQQQQGYPQQQQGYPQQQQGYTQQQQTYPQQGYQAPPPTAEAPPAGPQPDDTQDTERQSELIRALLVQYRLQQTLGPDALELDPTPQEAALNTTLRIMLREAKLARAFEIMDQFRAKMELGELAPPPDAAETDLAAKAMSVMLTDPMAQGGLDALDARLRAIAEEEDFSTDITTEQQLADAAKSGVIPFSELRVAAKRLSDSGLPPTEVMAQVVGRWEDTENRQKRLTVWDTPAGEYRLSPSHRLLDDEAPEAVLMNQYMQLYLGMGQVMDLFAE